jgi:hypothetical protein
MTLTREMRRDLSCSCCFTCFGLLSLLLRALGSLSNNFVDRRTNCICPASRVDGMIQSYKTTNELAVDPALLTFDAISTAP